MLSTADATAKGSASCLNKVLDTEGKTEWLETGELVAKSGSGLAWMFMVDVQMQVGYPGNSVSNSCT